MGRNVESNAGKQILKKRILLENYYLPGNPGAQIAARFNRKKGIKFQSPSTILMDDRVGSRSDYRRHHQEGLILGEETTKFERKQTSATRFPKLKVDPTCPRHS